MIPIEEVGDGVFSEKILGDGLAIEPESETVLAPGKGTVTTLMEDSRHAVGMVLENGVEILIHVGLDTVQMKGDGFAYLVKENQVVEAGTPLIQFSRETIQAAGKRDVAILAFTDGTDGKQFTFHTGIRAEAGKTEIVQIQ